MSFNSSRRASKAKKESIYREIGSGMFIAIRTVDEIEDIISTSEAYMTDPTVIFNKDSTKVLFYYNTKGRNEIEEMETLFKRTVKKGSTITLSDAFYLDESSGDDTTYDLSGTYKFEKYDATTKTIVASPISINKQSDTYSTYHSKYWTGSLLWTTSDPIHTTKTSYEIVNFLGNTTEHSFASVFGNIQENDRIEVKGVGEFTVLEYRVDEDESWERIVVKEPIPEKDLLGEKTFITILRSDRNQPKEPTQGTIPKGMVRSFDPRERPDWIPDWWPWLPDLVPEWSPISPGWTPSDIIPDKPDWWPTWLPWTPDYLPRPSDIIPDKPDWWPTWLPWTPDYLPGGPSDIIPDEPDWWPDWLPWNPLNIKLPSRDINLPRGNNTQIYMQALSVQRALYSLNIQTSNEVDSSSRMRGACCVGACNPGDPDGPRRCYPNRTKYQCESVTGLMGKWFKGEKCPSSGSGSNVRCCPDSWFQERSSLIYDREECINNPNTHWMPPDADYPEGWCMEGAEHPQQRQSTPPRNLNIRNPNNMGY